MRETRWPLSSGRGRFLRGRVSGMKHEEVEAVMDALQETVLSTWDEYGWIQGLRGDTSVGFCMVGAWVRATGLNVTEPFSMAFRSSFVSAASQLFPDRPHWSIAAFNDAKDTSEEDVRLVFKHAMESLTDLTAEVYSEVSGPGE